MRIILKNIGALREAQFELGDMTIICGRNNTGKTYATYALFGFLSYWRDAYQVRVSDETVTKLLEEGNVEVDLSEYVRDSSEILSDACRNYTKQLPKVFASSEKHFAKSGFEVQLDPNDIHVRESFESTMGTAQRQLFTILKRPGETKVAISLIVAKDKVRIPLFVIKQPIGAAIRDIVFDSLLPKPFIASAERTGAAIFRKELNFARNRLLDQMGSKDKEINPIELLTSAYSDYALPVKTNVDFTRQIEDVSKHTSFIEIEHPEVLTDFGAVIGGKYKVTRNDELHFLPAGTNLKLTMDESSSAVRSLLDIGFYLRHVAQKGDLLMVDEPELNLHPDNQRKVARLFARLVNLGIKVYITTHSDYIIKELNTLILLNARSPHTEGVAKRENYREQEFVSADRLKVFIAEKARIQVEGGQRKVSCQTLTAASVDPASGIEARSFDETIEDMNRIQDEIIWGNDGKE
jgi:AAA15 family ATPase/GTPase